MREMQLRELIEIPVLYSFIFSFGLFPAFLGFICGRYLPLWARLIPVFFIILTGYWMCKFSDHGFSAYVFGTILYIIMCILGLALRAKHLKIRFMKLHHIDWLVLSASLLIFVLVLKFCKIEILVLYDLCDR
ncbi:MAG: hypothetical protein B6I25_08190 [Planctomycetales bacterium 4572_13]|nr:MAG: hypothetical protein B6I25_08190 [Planctomycetales bacterium 4572_13]